jgi:hypothetical protein
MNKVVMALAMMMPAIVAEGAPMKAPSGEEFFNGLDKETTPLVERFYAESTHLVDPVVDYRQSPRSIRFRSF